MKAPIFFASDPEVMNLSSAMKLMTYKGHNNCFKKTFWEKRFCQRILPNTKILEPCPIDVNKKGFYF
jgi:hypothetical protein